VLSSSLAVFRPVAALRILVFIEPASPMSELAGVKAERCPVFIF
jgi:hypothetical protein